MFCGVMELLTQQALHVEISKLGDTTAQVHECNREDDDPRDCYNGKAEERHPAELLVESRRTGWAHDDDLGEDVVEDGREEERRSNDISRANELPFEHLGCALIS